MQGEYKTLSEELAERGEEEQVIVSLDLPMNGCMNESMDEYMSAFAEDNDTTNDEEGEQGDDTTSWSAAWDPEPGGSSVWTSENTSTRAETPKEASTAPSTQDTAATSPLPTAHENLKPQATDVEKGKENENACPPPIPRIYTAALSAGEPSAPPPSHEDANPPAPLRRSSGSANTTNTNTISQSNKGKTTEIELRERLRCLLLLRVPYLVSVGEG